MNQQHGNPRVRVLHASPGAPVMDVYVDGSPTFPFISFGQISEYTELPAGVHTVQLFPAGIMGEGIPLVAMDIGFGAGMDYTVAAAGRPEDMALMVVVDSSDFPGPERARVRLLHASPDAPALDLVIPRRTVLAQNVSFEQVSPWQDTLAGMTNLEVRRSGSEDALVTIPNYTMAGDTLYTFAALGLIEGAPGFMIMPLAETVTMRLPSW